MIKAYLAFVLIFELRFFLVSIQKLSMHLEDLRAMFQTILVQFGKYKVHLGHLEVDNHIVLPVKLSAEQKLNTKVEKIVD